MDNEWVKKDEWAIKRKLSLREETVLHLLIKAAGIKCTEEYFTDRTTINDFPYITHDAKYTTYGPNINRYRDLEAGTCNHLRKVTYIKVVRALQQLIKQESLFL